MILYDVPFLFRSLDIFCTNQLSYLVKINPLNIYNLRGVRVPPPEDKGEDGFRPNQAIDPNDYRFYSFVPDEITPETGYQPQPQKPVDRNPGTHQGRRKQDNRYNRSADKTPFF